MPITKEQAVIELQKRGVGTPTTGVSKAMAYRALKERGLSDDSITTELKPQTKSSTFWDSLVAEIPEYGGALIGGLIGGAKGVGVGTVGGPVGMAAGGILGAGFGAATGVATKQIAQHIADDPNAPTTSGEAAKEIALAGGRQAAYEAGGRGVVGVVGKVLAPFRKTITQEAVIATKALEKYMPKKFLGKTPALLPAEATENRILDIFENIAEGSLIGGKKIADYKNIIRPQAMSSMVDDLVKTFGEKAEPDLVGEAFTLAVSKGLKPSRLAATTLYNTVDDMTMGVKIPTVSLKSFAKPLAERAKELGSIEAKNAGDDLVQAIMELPDNVSYGTAKELRSRLISKIDEFSILNKKAPAIGKAKHTVGLIDSAIENTLKTQNPDALGLWRQANALYKGGSEQFDNDFIRGLIKQSVDKGNPEAIAKQIFKPGAISNIHKAKSAVDEKTWMELKSWYVQDIVKKSVSPSGELSGQTFVNQLTGKTGMGDKALAEIFNPEELQAVKNVGVALQIATRKQAEGVGKMWIQLTQAGAVIGLADERTRPYSMVLLGGPAVVSRLFTNPIAAKWLIQGVRLPAKSPQAAAILTKLGGLALTIKREEEMKQKMGKPLPPDVEAYKLDNKRKRAELFQSKGLQ